MRHVLLLLLASTAACRATGTFACERDDQCRGGPSAGTCETDGWCSFEDLGCTSGARYDELAGGGLAGQCVGGEDIIDAPSESTVTCYGVGVAQVCNVDAPAVPVVLDNTIINTDNSTMCADYTSPNGTTGCLIAGSTLTVTGVLRATGGRPLLLLATTTLTVSAGATIDVSSKRTPASNGAGANATQCTTGAAPTDTGATAGGGAGGTFGGSGGGGSAGADGGTGGTPGAPMVATTVRGGCPGGSGAGPTGGAGGAGGGAVFLLAGVDAQIVGNINASGAGANTTGAPADGGGGGGSGGMIGIDAATVVITGNVWANGGGGSGGSGSAASVGQPGNESTGPAATATGGMGGGTGGVGGAGSSGTTAAGGPGGVATGNDGGGGGGGGAGVIRIYPARAPSANVAPPAS